MKRVEVLNERDNKLFLNVDKIEMFIDVTHDEENPCTNILTVSGNKYRFRGTAEMFAEVLDRISQ